MIRAMAEMQRFERQYARTRWRDTSFAEALELFTALWLEAEALGVGPPASWQDDIAPDLAVARAVNGLPPTP